MVALASAGLSASLYMFYFGMINFWILPVVSAVYGLFWAINKVAQNSEKDFSRSYAIKLYAVASVIFFPLAALYFPSVVIQVYVLLGMASLASNIYELYKGERSKSVLSLIETLIENPQEFRKELSLLKPSRFEQIAFGVLYIFAMVACFTVSSDILMLIFTGICIFSAIVESIKDIALPKSKLENVSDENALSQVNELALAQGVQGA